MQIPGHNQESRARKLPKPDHIDVAFTPKTPKLRDGSPARGTLNMTDSAERPLIGPETGSDADAPDAIDAATETAPHDDGLMSVSPKQERTSPRWRADDADDSDTGARFQYDDMDDDGPVIRRIRNSHAPGMFSRQLDPVDGHDHDEFEPLAAPLPRERDAHYHHHPAAQAQFHQAQPRSSRRHEHEEFSVAAIREKRMRRPAGTHTPTRLGTKLTVAALASACMISAGVALGLYGQDIGRAIEQQARVASAAVNGAIGQVVSATVTSLDQGAGEKKVETSPTEADRTASAAQPAGEPASQNSAPATGRKLIYKRLPTAEENTASTTGTPREVRTVNAASLGGLEQLLAPPADFVPATRAVD